MTTRTQTLFIIACTFLLIGHLYLIGAAGLHSSLVEIMFKEGERFKGPYEFFASAGVVSWCLDYLLPKFK